MTLLMHNVGGVFTLAADQPAIPQVVNSVSWVAVLQLLVLPILFPVVVGLVSTSKWSTLAKRLSLGGLTLLSSVFAQLVQSATDKTPIDIGALILQFLLTWGLAELAYWKLIKVPATTTPTTTLNLDGSTTYTPPTSVASIVQAVGDTPPANAIIGDADPAADIAAHGA